MYSIAFSSNLLIRAFFILGDVGSYGASIDALFSVVLEHPTEIKYIEKASVGF